MHHVVLLGDSILDNAAYVRGAPDVAAQLAALLPAGGRVTRLAEDGATTTTIGDQIGRIPADATHLVLSVGGNDALGHAALLQRPATQGAEVLAWFAEAIAVFAPAYRVALDRLVRTGRSVVACTIYDGNFAPAMRAATRAGVALFDDAIQRAAREVGVPVLELRDVCTEPADYANAIEPSAEGGQKLAAAILRAVGGA